MRINKVDLHVAGIGDGPGAVVFSHGMLIRGVMFDPQVAALSRRYRCVVHDHRDQGRSAVPQADHDMGTPTDDAIEPIETLGVGTCHFAGLSMGGAAGLRTAIRAGGGMIGREGVSAQLGPSPRRP